MKNIFLLLLMFSCTSPNLSNSIETKVERLKVVEIKSYNTVYELKTVKENTVDTMLVISYKKGFHNGKGKTKSKIIEGEYYKFELSTVRPRVSTMEQLGAYMIFAEDTLYSASDYKKLPKMYKSYNSSGLYIYE